MAIKNILCALTATILFSTYSTSALDTSERSTLTEEWVLELLERNSNQPQNPEKTPTTPDIIEHQPNMFKGRQRIFGRKRIYFGTDQSGNPCYATIWQHAKDNPAFGDVRLVIFQGNSKLAKFVNEFRVIGTYADETKHHQLKNSIAKHGGVWCPEQNAIIAGTRDKNICTIFTEFEKEIANQPKSKIFKN